MTRSDSISQAVVRGAHSSYFALFTVMSGRKFAEYSNVPSQVSNNMYAVLSAIAMVTASLTGVFVLKLVIDQLQDCL